MVLTITRKSGTEDRRVRRTLDAAHLLRSCRMPAIAALAGLICLVPFATFAFVEERQEGNEPRPGPVSSCKGDAQRLASSVRTDNLHSAARKTGRERRKREKSRSDVSIRDDNPEFRQKCPVEPWQH